MMDHSTDIAESRIYPQAAVRAIDRLAIERAGISGRELMQRAAQFAFDVARAAHPSSTHWQILCGGGNNGGDGYALAALARAAGLRVDAIWLSDPGTLGGDAALACKDFADSGGRAEEWSGSLDPQCDLLFDAMLGSGLSRSVDGPYRDAVQACNAHPAPVVSLDVPTGLHGDSGAIMGVAIEADATVTFVGRTAGLYVGAGPDCVGRLYFSDLGIPGSCYADVQATLRLVTASLTAAQLPRRPRQSHKGDFGHVLVVGGAPGMPGAVRLAAEAALRAGAGRVSVATHPAHAASIPTACPELMCHGVDAGDDLVPLLDSATVVAIGPGLGRNAWSRWLLDAVRASGLPLVLDADALNLLAGDPGPCDDGVLTPHPGEAARLLGIAAADVQADRRAAVCNLQQRFRGTVVLKGRGTLVAGGSGLPWLSNRGNPGMATAGMGDVLTGIIAGLRAQGMSGEMAAVVGVDVHARAADMAATGGERGLVASDVLQDLRAWLNP